MLSHFARLAASIGHARTRYLLVAGGLVIGLTLAAVMIWFVMELRQHAIADATRELSNDALMLAEEEDRLLQSVEVVQQSLIEHMSEIGIDSPEKFELLMASREVHRELGQRIAGLPHIGALALNDRHGGLLNFSRAWPPLKINDADRDFIHELTMANAPKTFISQPSLSKTTGQWTIYLSRRFNSANGQLIGFVVSTIGMDYFEQFYARLPLSGGGSFTLYRRDGMLMARYPHVDMKVGKTFAGTENFNRLLASLDKGVVRQQSLLDGKDRLIAPYAMPHFPLIVLVTDTMESILRSWRAEARMFGGTTALLELVIVATILLTMRQLRGYEKLQAAQAELVIAEERTRAAQALHTHEERFDTALNNMLQGLIMFDGAGRLLVVNRRMHHMFGVPDDALTPGMTYREMTDRVVEAGEVTAKDMEGVRERRTELIARNERATATWEISSGRAFNMNFQPMEDGWLTTFEEITDRLASEARMVHLAHHDSLTDLPNRLLFRQKLEHALAYVRRGDALALLFLDLDQFKAVNDTLGHPIGDALLRAVAERLVRHNRDTDTVARIGGDEFAIVQSRIASPTEATALAERLIRLFDTPFEVHGHQIEIGTSVGIVLAPQDGTDTDQLLKSADLALYRAKSDGRGVYRLFQAEMDAQMQMRRLLELDLRQALHAGQFELFFQPVVDLRAGMATGLEALLRWRHPERGLVSPGDFIPLAEDTGLIVPIGEWVLHQACATAMSWPGDQCVAVNLSPAQFKSRYLVASVAHALSVSQLPPDRLELEITETVMLQDTDATLVTLHQLRALGVAIALDDFGTGYSSLSYLRRFPFDRIKIDQSFVRELSSKQDCGAIVRAVTGLSRDLGMATTAEGVETQEQLALLRSAGCTEVQGYLFSRPVPSGDVVRVLRSIDEMLQQPVDRPVFEPIE
jgi:diguanylate cyclase (GGDEF)-like protein